MFKEYKKSLKKVEAEEVLDLLIFRPLGFFLAFFLKKSFITPNTITVFSMISGLFAGYFLYMREYYPAAILLFLTNIFDCADGQLARLKNQFSPIGRILDGFSDYLTYTASYVGLAFGLERNYNEISYIYLGIFAGMSTIFQAALFDDYRNIFIESKNIDKLKKEFLDIKMLKTQTKNFVYKILYFLYMIYINSQIRIRKKTKLNFVTPIFIRLLSFVGSTTHITLLILLLVIKKPEYYFFTVSTFLNIYVFILLLLKNKLNKKL